MIDESIDCGVYFPLASIHEPATKERILDRWKNFCLDYYDELLSILGTKRLNRLIIGTKQLIKKLPDSGIRPIEIEEESTDKDDKPRKIDENI